MKGRLGMAKVVAAVARGAFDPPSRLWQPPSCGGYRNLAGWTNRRYQRAAAKLRNQKRNRKQQHD